VRPPGEWASHTAPGAAEEFKAARVRAYVSTSDRVVVRESSGATADNPLLVILALRHSVGAASRGDGVACPRVKRFALSAG
jgi:hypothetical protein